MGFTWGYFTTTIYINIYMKLSHPTYNWWVWLGPTWHRGPMGHFFRRQVPLTFFKIWVPAVKAHAKSLGKKSFGNLEALHRCCFFFCCCCSCSWYSCYYCCSCSSWFSCYDCSSCCSCSSCYSCYYCSSCCSCSSWFSCYACSCSCSCCCCCCCCGRLGQLKFKVECVC